MKIEEKAYEEIDPDTQRDFYTNMSGLPFIGQVGTGADIGSTLLRIVETIKTTVQTDFRADFIYPIRHTTKRRLYVFGRYRSLYYPTSDAWTTMQNIEGINLVGQTGVWVHTITKSEINLYVNLDPIPSAYPEVEIELYLVELEI